MNPDLLGMRGDGFLKQGPASSLVCNIDRLIGLPERLHTPKIEVFWGSVLGARGVSWVALMVVACSISRSLNSYQYYSFRFLMISVL